MDTNMENTMSESMIEAMQIQCDNPVCDHVDDTVTAENISEFLNLPCPKCGENLLTQDDFDTVERMLELTNGAGDLDPGAADSDVLVSMSTDGQGAVKFNLKS
jgi:predicted RNA-binding Zn-ribbon protein involved in translation (DUF1610 family)